MSQIPQYESITVEFKRQWSEKKDGESIKKTIVAFANTAGGDLYIGVEDDGSINGVSNAGKIEERLASTVRDNISPSLAGSITTMRLKEEGKTVLRVHVEAGPMRPYCLDPKSASSVYVRIANTSSPATLDDIARMVRENNPVPFEERISFEQKLTFEKCQAFCAERHLDFDPSANLTYGFWNRPQKSWTNLGYICSDQCPAAVVMIEFADDAKLQLLNSHRVQGPVFELYERAIEFIGRTNYAWAEKPQTGNVERRDHYFVPPRVVFEAVVNMIAHRDYSRNTASLIHITPSAIEINTIGGLADDLDLGDIVIRMSTECRNPRLARLLGDLRLMENRGTGFRLIREHYQQHDLSDLLSVSRNSFTIRLPRDRREAYTDDAKMREMAGVVYDCISQKGVTTRKEVQGRLGVSQSSAVNLLREMVSKNLIETEGGGRSTKYRLKR